MLFVIFRSDQTVYQQRQENQQLCQGGGASCRREEGKSRHREETCGRQLRHRGRGRADKENLLEILQNFNSLDHFHCHHVDHRLLHYQ